MTREKLDAEVLETHERYAVALRRRDIAAAEKAIADADILAIEGQLRVLARTKVTP